MRLQMYITKTNSNCLRSIAKTTVLGKSAKKKKKRKAQTRRGSKIHVRMCIAHPWNLSTIYQFREALARNTFVTKIVFLTMPKGAMRIEHSCNRLHCTVPIILWVCVENLAPSVTINVQKNCSAIHHDKHYNWIDKGHDKRREKDH